MAFCSACGAELTGPYCDLCGAKAAEERTAKPKPKHRTESPSLSKSGAAEKRTASGKGLSPFSPQRIWRTVAMACAALLLFGSGVVTGIWLGQGSTPAGLGMTPAGGITDADLTGLSDLARANFHMEQGVGLMNEGQRSAAVSEFRKALKAWELVLQAEPDNLYAQTYQGLTYYYAGDGKRAIQTLEAALAQDPNYLWAIFNLAWIHETNERPAEAKAAYQHYVEVAEAEKADLLKYAEQYELIDRQIEASRQAVARLSGGGSGQ